MILTCNVDGCDNKRDGRGGMCGKHRYRVRLYGSPFVTKNNPPGTGFNALGYRATQIDGVKKFEHVRIAESALGKELPAGAVVHHVDGSRDNNSNDNLVVCPDRAYHNLLHARMDAVNASGNPDFRKCRWCGVYADMSEHRHKAKHLDSETIYQIRTATGTQSSIAARFSIDQSQVSRIKNGKSFKE